MHRHPSDEEIALLRKEIELLIAERQLLLKVAGAAAVLVANLDSDSLPREQDTIDAAEVLAESLNDLPEETLKDALDAVQAVPDPRAQAEAEAQAHARNGLDEEDRLVP
ncbi:MAG: hypothetical protein RMK60_07170 [Burkholderiales bacterium]|nr:hypothetical protein [Burkholderiales bacterium]